MYVYFGDSLFQKTPISQVGDVRYTFHFSVMIPPLSNVLPADHQIISKCLKGRWPAMLLHNSHLSEDDEDGQHFVNMQRGEHHVTIA